MNGRRGRSVFALLLVLVMLVGCAKSGPSSPGTKPPETKVTTPTPPAGKGIQPKGDVKPNVANDPFKAQVAAGALPALDKRLPEHPMALAVNEAIGTYGGQIVTFVDHPNADQLKMWLYDPPIRWKADYSGYEPNLAEKFEFSADGKSVTFSFRKGLKWSDGKPFTTTDLMFWWEDLANVPGSGYSVPWWGRNADQSPMQVKALNEYEIQFTFKEPNWTVPYIIAQGFWEWDALMKPKHYLSQFHPKYNAELSDYAKLIEMDKYMNNPAYPTLYAWVVTQWESGKQVVLERNPYYWKIDPEGNQLPYIDKIIALEIKEEEARVVKALAGEFDLTIRGINPKNIPTLVKNEEKGNYKVVKWTNGAGAWPGFLINQDYVGDQYMRDLLRNSKFRQAMSIAIDRENINEAVWNGMGTIQQGTITKESPHFADPEGQKLFAQWQKSYAEFDRATAERMLDDLGLKKNAQGVRMRPDGKPLEITIDVTDWGGLEPNQQAAAMIKEDWEKIGVKVYLYQPPDPERATRFDSAEWMFSSAHGAELDLFTYPDWVFPVRGNRAWPLQGRWFEFGGERGEKPFENSPAQKLNDLYHKGLAMKELSDKHKVVQEAVRYLLDEGPFYLGVTGGIPEPVIVRNGLKNLQEVGVLGPWAPGSPGNTNLTTLYWAK